MSDLSTVAPSVVAVPLSLAEKDRRVIARLTGVAAFVLLLLGGVSFTAGIPGLLAAGGWAQLGGISWLLPIVVDGGLLFFAVTAMAFRAETGRASFLAWGLVLLLSAASVAAQVAHVFTGHGGRWSVESVVGACIASLFPLVVLASTRSFEMLRFGNLVNREAARITKSAARSGRKPATRRPATAAATTPVSGRVPVMAGQVAATAAGAAAAARPKRSPVAAAKPAKDPAVREAAVSRVLAGESQRAVALELGVSRAAIQSWLPAA